MCTRMPAPKCNDYKMNAVIVMNGDNERQL